ncbi:hypothetical protein LTR66_006915 [Elasticomyces elasticus]|nr:hypothetical protein LTR66_006915 [Elasticomyces elasticus]
MAQYAGQSNARYVTGSTDRSGAYHAMDHTFICFVHPAKRGTDIQEDSNRRRSTRDVPDASLRRRKKVRTGTKTHFRSEDTDSMVSTVSKVLRKTDMYLGQDNGRNPLVERLRGNPPDIERTLARWAQTRQKKGVKLSDDNIKERYFYFAAGIGSSALPSTSWIERFKQKYDLLDEKRRGSLAVVPECDSDAVSSSHASSGRSPTSPNGAESSSPSEGVTQHSHESIKMDSPDTFFDVSNIHWPLHPQSSTSLSSAFTDTTPFSCPPRPPSPTSPCFAPDAATALSPFIPRSSRRLQLLIPAGSDTQRPRGPTVPPLEQHTAPTPFSETPTPEDLPSMALDFSMEEAARSPGTTNQTPRRHPHTPVE